MCGVESEPNDGTTNGRHYDRGRGVGGWAVRDYHLNTRELVVISNHYSFLIVL